MKNKNINKKSNNNLSTGEEKTNNDLIDNLPKDLKKSYLKNGYGIFVKKKDGSVRAEYIPPSPCND